MIPGLDVAVPSFSKTVPEGHNAPDIEFEVVRTYRDETLSMMCRYSALRDLMNQLSYTDDLDMVKCPFSPKDLNLPYTKLSDEKLQDRCSMLEAFLKAVVHANLSHEGTEILRKFFKLDKLHEVGKSTGLTVQSKHEEESKPKVDASTTDNASTKTKTKE